LLAPNTITQSQSFCYVLPWYQQGISPLPCHTPTSWFFGPVLCTSISWNTDVLATLHLHSLVSCKKFYSKKTEIRKKNKIGTNITKFHWYGYPEVMFTMVNSHCF
jgi:hypothetical protein